MRIDPLSAFAVALPIVASLLVAVIALFSLLKQLISRRHHPRRGHFKAFAASAAIGLAFLPLAAIYRPSLVEVVKAQIRQEEDVDEEETGSPESPLKHLWRQLRCIRRGERVDFLILHRE